MKGANNERKYGEKIQEDPQAIQGVAWERSGDASVLPIGRRI